jgi:hypothetical protein
VKTPSDLALLVQQKTWDKDVVLWVGSEARLRESLGSAQVAVLDLLDLFDPNRLPMDDEETRSQLQRNLRAWLQTLAPGPANRTVLLVRSAGLLARYQIGAGDFFEWFCGDFAMAVLVLGRLPATGFESDGVVCVPERLVQYFHAPEVVKQVYAER